MLAATEPIWENRGLSRSDEFEELKANGKLLYGQVPLLEIDGHHLVQSQSIIRYLAHKHNLQGSTPKEAALCDMVAEGCLDFRRGLLMYPFNPQKVATKECFDLVNKFGPVFENLLGENLFIAGGNSMTYADILLAEVLMGYEERFAGGMQQQFPNLDQLRVRICQVPGIANYLQSDKRYPFPTGDIGSAYVHNVREVLNG
mmetsp:Transcript_25167/g.54786  ORF Transcript_25167/g.54786 Transcript_25167/m.54786 type:complete len:201 (-) Transcript_25167:97-699(-)